MKISKNASLDLFSTLLFTDKISLNKCGNFIKHPVDDRDGLCLDNIIFTIVTPIKLFLMCRLTKAIILCSVIDLLSKILVQISREKIATQWADQGLKLKLGTTSV